MLAQHRCIPVWNSSFSKGPVESSSASRVEHTWDAPNLVISKQGFQKTRKALKTQRPRKLWFEKVQRTKSGGFGGSQLEAIFL